MEQNPVFPVLGGESLFAGNYGKRAEAEGAMVFARPFSRHPEVWMMGEEKRADRTLQRFEFCYYADNGDIADPVETTRQPGRINVGKVLAQQCPKGQGCCRFVA